MRRCTLMCTCTLYLATHFCQLRSLQSHTPHTSKQRNPPILSALCPACLDLAWWPQGSLNKPWQVQTVEEIIFYLYVHQHIQPFPHILTAYARKAKAVQSLNRRCTMEMLVACCFAYYPSRSLALTGRGMHSYMQSTSCCVCGQIFTQPLNVVLEPLHFR